MIIILIGIILMVVSTVSLTAIAIIDGSNAYRAHRAEQARIERQQHWAERRLHDVSARAFGEMVDAARQAPGSDRNWWT
ncbi:MAG TPA: hypothetical protein VMR18_00890 [Candidatus Saccharimonadales bacterium]|jgi:hypothetical protein|nr:hypothetical protein [Candidatus Saccharimonadales bacterium]